MNKIKCLICKKTIPDEELEYEDYYKVLRGETAEQGYIHFDCFHVATNPDKVVIFNVNGVDTKLGKECD